jgi:hypothetical protein
MENIRNNKKLALYIKIYLFIITFIIISFQYTTVSANENIGLVRHVFNDDNDIDISLTWSGNISSVTSMSKTAYNQLVSTAESAKHYLITLPSPGYASLGVSYVGTNLSASGVAYDYLFGCKIEKVSNTQWKVWFCAMPGYWNGYTRLFNISGVAISGSISASPNTVIIPPGSSQGTTNITWSTTGSTANVYVACNSGPESLFASGNTGTAVAPWIGVGNCVFRLKSPDGTILSSVTVTGVQVSGTISASPSTVIIPQNSSQGTTTITWSTTGLNTANIYVACNSGPESLFASLNTGTAVAPWIGVGNCVFRLKSPTGTILSSVTVTGVQVTPGQVTPVSGTISASPNTVIIPQNSSQGTTTITWSTTGLDTANIYVSCNSGPESLFASLNTGTAVAPWIGVGNCVFRLKSPDGTILSSVTVTGVQVSGTISASPSTVIIPQNSSQGTTTITWSTTGLNTANIYVACNSGPESLFASLNTGTAVAPWIGVGNCVFRLKSPTGTILSSVTVTGVQANQAPTARYDKTDNISYNTAIAHWEYSDPDGDPQTDIEVKVYINSDYNTGQVFTGVAAGADVRSLNIITGLIPGETYYPKIRVRDSNSTWSNWSNGTAFTTTEYPEPSVDFNLKSGSTTVAKGETLTIKTGDPIRVNWNITNTDGVDLSTCRITTSGVQQIFDINPLESFNGGKSNTPAANQNDQNYVVRLQCEGKTPAKPERKIDQTINVTIRSRPVASCTVQNTVVTAANPIVTVDVNVSNATPNYTWQVNRGSGGGFIPANPSPVNPALPNQIFDINYSGTAVPSKYQPSVRVTDGNGRSDDAVCNSEITNLGDRNIREIAP